MAVFCGRGGARLRRSLRGLLIVVVRCCKVIGDSRSIVCCCVIIVAVIVCVTHVRLGGGGAIVLVERIRRRGLQAEHILQRGTDLQMSTVQPIIGQAR